MVEVKGVSFSLNSAQESRAQRACLQEEPAGVPETFGLVPGSSAGSSTNLLYELGKSLNSSGYTDSFLSVQ